MSSLKYNGKKSSFEEQLDMSISVFYFTREILESLPLKCIRYIIAFQMASRRRYSL